MERENRTPEQIVKKLRDADAIKRWLAEQHVGTLYIADLK